MSCIRSCYDKGNTNFGHEDCTTCIHGDRPPKPKREWVGLTDEEINSIRTEVIRNMGVNFQETLCKAVDAKLKEKNT